MIAQNVLKVYESSEIPAKYLPGFNVGHDI
jgi:hypothetical protein